MTVKNETASQAEVDTWLDEALIIRKVNTFFRAMDEKHFDDSYLGQILAADVQMIRPNGAVTVGTANIADSFARSFDRFEATQHLLTGHHVDVDGDTAAARANLVAIHLWKDRPVESSMLDRSFTAGGVITADLRRSPDGWRICRAETLVLWRTGFFGDMLQTR
jgi:ketosteroid isomerase-like protein